MRYRLLGRSGLRVSELFLGGSTFAVRGDAETARRHRQILTAYADAGGNVIDSASAYGDSEVVLGELLWMSDHMLDGAAAVRYPSVLISQVGAPGVAS